MTEFESYMIGERKLPCVCIALFSVLILLLSAVSIVQAEAKSKHKSRKVKQEVTASIPSDQRAGVFIGNLILVDRAQSSIYVKPDSRSGPQKRFYYDGKTVFYADSKALSVDELPLGSRVALKYFGEGRIFVADTLNIIPADLQVSDRLIKGWMRGGRGTSPK